MPIENDASLTPIERGAKAIYRVYEDALADDNWHERFARAALESIAEPTPEMITAATVTVLTTNLNGRDLWVAVWRAMHAAMLKEKEEKK